MPNLPISQLPSLTNPQLSSVIPISEGSTTYRTTLGAIVSYISQSVANTGSFATTGSNTFIGTEVVSGSVFITGSLILTGSTNITGSLTVNNYPVITSNQTGSLVSYYGSFYHTASMTLASPNVATTMSFSTTDISYGVSISGSSNDKIKFDNAGVYNVQFSAQLDKTNSSNATVYIWLAKNDSDIPITNTGITLGGGTNDAIVAAWNFFVDANAGDYVQLKWGANNTNSRLLYTPTASVGPAVPSIILTANRVS
jgi:hypothetical protein